MAAVFMICCCTTNCPPNGEASKQPPQNRRSVVPGVQGRLVLHRLKPEEAPSLSGGPAFHSLQAPANCMGPAHMRENEQLQELCMLYLSMSMYYILISLFHSLAFIMFHILINCKLFSMKIKIFIKKHKGGASGWLNWLSF